MSAPACDCERRRGCAGHRRRRASAHTAARLGAAAALARPRHRLDPARGWLVKPVAFDYVAARSLGEALDALVAGGEDAKPIAGGQSLVPALNMRLVRPTLLVEPSNRAGLDGIVRGERQTCGSGQWCARRRSNARRTRPPSAPAGAALRRPFRDTEPWHRGRLAFARMRTDRQRSLSAWRHWRVDRRGRVRGWPSRDRTSRHLLRHPFPHHTRPQPSWSWRPLWPDSHAEGEGCSWFSRSLHCVPGDYALSMVAAVVRRVDGAAHDVRIRVGAVTDRPTALPRHRGGGRGCRHLTATTARDAGAAAAAAIETYGSIHASADYLRELTGTLVERAAVARLGRGRMTLISLTVNERAGRRRHRAAAALDRLPPSPPRPDGHARRVRARRLRRRARYSLNGVSVRGCCLLAVQADGFDDCRDRRVARRGARSFRLCRRPSSATTRSSVGSAPPGPDRRRRPALRGRADPPGAEGDRWTCSPAICAAAPAMRQSLTRSRTLVTHCHKRWEARTA